MPTYADLMVELGEARAYRKHLEAGFAFEISENKRLEARVAELNVKLEACRSARAILAKRISESYEGGGRESGSGMARVDAATKRPKPLSRQEAAANPAACTCLAGLFGDPSPGNHHLVDYPTRTKE